MRILRRGDRVTRFLVVPACGLALVGGLAACDDDTAGPEEGTSVENVVEEPSALVGQTVTISSEVEEVIGPNAFVLNTPEEAADGGLLVVSAPAAGNAVVEEGTAVQVTGTVRDPFVLTEVEDDFGIDLGDDELVEYEDDAYIEATRVGPVREPDVE